MPLETENCSLSSPNLIPPLKAECRKHSCHKTAASPSSWPPSFSSGHYPSDILLGLSQIYPSLHPTCTHRSPCPGSHGGPLGTLELCFLALAQQATLLSSHCLQEKRLPSHLLSQVFLTRSQLEKLSLYMP